MQRPICLLARHLRLEYGLVSLLVTLKSADTMKGYHFTKYHYLHNLDASYLNTVTWMGSLMGPFVRIILGGIDGHNRDELVWIWLPEHNQNQPQWDQILGMIWIRSDSRAICELQLKSVTFGLICIFFSNSKCTESRRCSFGQEYTVHRPQLAPECINSTETGPRSSISHGAYSSITSFSPFHPLTSSPHPVSLPGQVRHLLLSIALSFPAPRSLPPPRLLCHPVIIWWRVPPAPLTLPFTHTLSLSLVVCYALSHKSLFHHLTFTLLLVRGCKFASSPFTAFITSCW